MKKRKWLSVLLAAVMVLAMVPMTVFAAGATGDWGSDYDTAAEFTISTEAELRAFAALVNEGKNFAGKTVKLAENITMSSETWIPIGSTLDEEGDGIVGTNKFAGIFDGQGNTISNLTCTNSITDDTMTLYDATGLFGIVSGTVQNLNVTDANITAAWTGGVIAGLLDGGTIKNCTASGTMHGFEYDGDLLADQLGGIVGEATGETIISGCESAVSVSGMGNIGGILGYVEGAASATIENCDNTGNIEGTAGAIGGIVGNLANGELKSCVNSGNITGSNNIGGIAGTIIEVTIDGCTNSGAVSAPQNSEDAMLIGGIVGNTTNQTLAIKNCVNKGSVNGGKNTGGIAGLNQGVAISACTNTGDVTGTENVGGISGSMRMAKNAQTQKPGSVTNCTSNGAINGTTNVGGIVGVNNESTLGDDTTPSEIKDCIVTGNVTGTADNAVVGVIVGVNNTNEEQAGIIQNNYWPESVGTNAVGSGAGSSDQANESVGNNSAWDKDGNMLNPDVEDDAGQKIDGICDVVGHSDMTKTEEQAPTCTEPGHEAYWVCGMCGKYFSDEACNTEIELADTVISATGHAKTEIKNAKDATCTEEGYTGDKVCKDCGEVLEKGKVIAKVAHTYKDGKCTVCGAADPDYKPDTKPTEPTKPEDKPTTDAPQTGDTSNMGLWFVLMAAAGIGLAGTAVYGRKKHLQK